MEIIITIVLALIALGFFSILLNTTIGGGAAVVLVPLLILVFGLSANASIATSFAVITIGALVSTAAYSRQGLIDYRMGVLLGVLTLPGAILGAFISGLMQGSNLEFVLGIVIMAVAVSALVGARRRTPEANIGGSRGDVSGANLNYAVKRKLLVIGAIATGFFAGTFGAAGGLILTPVMIIGGFPIQMALGTVRLIALVLALGASVTRFSLGQVDTFYVLWLSLGAVGGGIVGARLVGVVKAERLNWMVSIGIFLLGLILAARSM